MSVDYEATMAIQSLMSDTNTSYKHKKHTND